jgi:glycosyltransferase involved in cell wall biosynthesis
VLDKFSKPKYYRYVRTVQAVSSALAIFAKNAGMPDVVVIPNGIETSFYRPSESHESKNRLREQWSVGSDERIILAAGRFVEWKGFDVLLSAFADVHRRFLSSGRDFPFRLFLAGMGRKRRISKRSLRTEALKTISFFPVRSGHTVFTPNIRHFCSSLKGT